MKYPLMTNFAKHFSKNHLQTLSLILLLLLTTAISAGEKLEAHDAWVREAPPNAAVMAAYLTLHNHSPKTFTLISISSPDFNRVEMHRTEQHDGMTKMHPVSRVMLSTNGSVSFQPGGMHLMLMKPKKRFKSGDLISLTLFFTDESSLNISVPVKKGTGDSSHKMHHGDHSTHDAMHDSSHDSSHNMHDKKNNKNHHH